MITLFTITDEKYWDRLYLVQFLGNDVIVTDCITNHNNFMTLGEAREGYIGFKSDWAVLDRIEVGQYQLAQGAVYNVCQLLDYTPEYISDPDHARKLLINNIK